MADNELQKLKKKNKAQKNEIAELKETLRVIQSGEVDALVVNGPLGERIFTLQSAEQPYRELVEAMNEGAVTVTPDGIILYCNAKFESMTKGKSSKIIGSDFRAHIHPRSRSAVEKLLESAKTSPTVGEVFLYLGSGEALPVQLSLAPIELVGTDGFCIIATDLTAQKKSAAERDNLLKILEANPSPNALWRTKDLIFERVSPSYQALFPYKVLIGKPFREALPVKEYLELCEIIKGVFDSGNSVTLPEHLVQFDVDGKGMKPRYHTLSFFQIKASDGQPYGVYQQAVDMTEQILAREILKASAKALEAEQAELAFERKKLETVVANSTASIAVLRGQNFVFELTNKSYEELFSHRELVGKSLLEALPELADQPFPKHAQSVFETGIPYVEKEAYALLKRTKDGPLEERYFDQIYSQVLDQKNQPYGIFIHAQEVTDRVTYRHALEIAKAEAEHSNQTKSAFLANMSHEIRTPLGAILGFTDLLRDKNLDPKDREQFLDTISRSGKALTRIIDDILDLAKVESGKLEIEMIEFSLTELIEEVIDLFRERVRTKGLYLKSKFDSGILPNIVSDPTRLRQILINVIGNAVKFTHAGGVEVNVSLEAGKDNKAILKISVKDTGVGLNLEQRERLFQPFTQADNSTTRKFGGTGLGLNLSQRLAHALGGEISIVDCALEAGCTFIVSVAVEISKNQRSLVKKDEKNKSSLDFNNGEMPLSGLKILVADDSEDNQELIGQLLSKLGATVDIAENGRVAFQKGLQVDFDIVLMDIQMPEMDGYEATRSLRASGFKRPIIALTAHAMAEEREKTIAAGCDGHLTKPINFQELISSIQSLTKD